MLQIFEILNKLSGVIIAVVALFISYRYNRHRHAIEVDKVKKELFTEFNKRYDQLNGILLQIDSGKSYQDLKKENPDKARALNDYLNLCAEEYYWYKRARLDQDIWKAWNTGMRYWYRHLKSL